MFQNTPDQLKTQSIVRRRLFLAAHINKPGWFTKTFSIKLNAVLNGNTPLILLDFLSSKNISIKFGIVILLVHILIVIIHGSAEVRTADKAGIDQ